jgi:hypothetical protein
MRDLHDNILESLIDLDENRRVVNVINDTWLPHFLFTFTTNELEIFYLWQELLNVTFSTKARNYIGTLWRTQVSFILIFE